MFRTINYGKMLYETLRAYFAVNANGELSILYKFLYGCLYPLQPAFNDYDAFRIKKQIIAGCKWQIGQLTNVLNYFFDPDLKRIYITQNSVEVIADPTFDYAPVLFDTVFEEAPEVFEITFGNVNTKNLVTFNIPAAVNMDEITSIIEQVKMNGIPYLIQTF